MTTRAMIMLFVCLLVIAGVVNSQHYQANVGRNDYAAFLRGQSRRRISNSNTFDTPQEHLTLIPGDLPTDSGWARPTTTDAAKYRVVSTTPNGTPATNQWLHLQVKCDDCHAFAKPLFFARMYGPSVLTGHVTTQQDGLYDVAFLPLDAGEYFIEIVLEFSSTPDFVEYPNVASMPGYEGHLLPGFPLKVTVEQDSTTTLSASAPSTKQPLCSANELYLKDYDLGDGLGKGRWQVTDKQQLNTEDSTQSLITMKYQPKQDCALVPLMGDSAQQLLDQCTYKYVSNTYKESIHLILIGDSVMGLQYRHLLNACVLPAGLRVDFIYNGGGLEATYSNVTSTLTKLAADNPKSERIVVFNSGMHDIMVLFNQMAFQRKHANETSVEHSNNSNDEYYRTFRYRHAMEKFATFLSTYPASNVIFQTTTAAWPKWGNGGLHWPGHKEQPHLLSTHAAEQYNRIALHVFSTLAPNKIKVLDAYWMSLARPDCREINPDKGRRAKLAHPGEEVVNAMMQTILTVIVSQLGCLEK